MARTPYNDPQAEKTFRTTEREMVSYKITGQIKPGRAHVMGSELARQGADSNSGVDTFEDRWRGE